MSQQNSNFNSNNNLTSSNNMDEEIRSYMVILFIFFILMSSVGTSTDDQNSYAQNFIYFFIILGILFVLIYNIKNILNIQSSNCNYINKEYPSLNGYIRPITSDFSGNLSDYYVKTAYNACSGGSYSNDYVDVCILKALIKQGIRCLDFEIYSIDDKPVVATSATSNFFVKETFNYVYFEEVMNIINNYAFTSGTCINYTDPLMIHLRFKSNNQKMYSNLANIFQKYDGVMVGKQNSYIDSNNIDNVSQNIGTVPLKKFMNKIILIVDRSNTAFLENKALLEYVNTCSNSIYMRLLKSNDVTLINNDNNLKKDLINFNVNNLSIVIPDNGSNPYNPNGTLARNLGCQMVAMRYQYNDDYLKENNLYFDTYNYAFYLKPVELRTLNPLAQTSDITTVELAKKYSNNSAESAILSAESATQSAESAILSQKYANKS